MYEVYLHKNIVTGKIYVGFTSKTTMKRWKDHVSKARETSKTGKSLYFHRSILKHGEDKWEHHVLERVPTLEEAKAAETKWIAHYNTTDRTMGYNCTSGGEHPIWTKESREKLSNSVRQYMSDPANRENNSRKMKEHWSLHENPFLGKQHSEESKKIMGEKSREYQEEHGNPFSGKTHDEETRQRMSDLAKERCADPNWLAPVQRMGGWSEETKKKMSDAKKGKPTGKISKEMLLEACRGARTQKEVARMLGCTPANISYLSSHFDVKEEIKNSLRKKK